MTTTNTNFKVKNGLDVTGAIGVGSTPSYGTSGQVLTSGGTGVAPSWTTVSGVGTSSGLTVSATPPTSPTPVEGDVWYNSTTTRTYVYYDSYWVESAAPVASVGQYDGGTPTTNFGGIAAINAGGV